MPEPQKLDIVFVVCTNNSRSSSRSHKTDATISRVSQHLTSLNKHCRVASIRFKEEYNSGAGVSLFCSNVSDFSGVYCDGKTNEGNPLQYGYPLQHVANLSFRQDATKICFLVSNVLPFNDSCEEKVIYKNEINIASTNNETNQPDNNTNTDDCTSYQNNKNQQNEDTANTRVSKHQTSNSNIVYHEDPLRSCRILAALGVVLYTIETLPGNIMYKDMYDALCYITGGQYLNVHQSQLAKAIKAGILEEVSLEHLVGYVQDYLCIAWLAWGRMKTKKPRNLQELTENVLNYLHKVNITRREILIDNKPLTPPSSHAKILTTLKNIAEARRIKETEDDWAAEISWVMPEVCNEVIPGYDNPATGKSRKANIKKVTISACKTPPRHQVERVVVRTLARRTGMIKKQEQPVSQVEKTSYNMNNLGTENIQDIDSAAVQAVQKDLDVENSNEHIQRTKYNQYITNSCNPEKVNTSGIHSKEQLVVVSCTQELIAEKLTEKCTAVTCKNCVLV